MQEWDSIEQFKKELIRYIHYYNNDRIKLRLNGKSPVQVSLSSIQYSIKATIPQPNLPKFCIKTKLFGILSTETQNTYHIDR